MNAFLNSVKVLLAAEVKNNPDWLLKFLALEASDFFAQIHFLDFTVCWFLWLFCASFYLSQFST